LAWADAPDSTAIRAGLRASGRDARERAADAIRRWARTDPAGAAALWDGIGVRERALLAHALASTGTRHAAQVALERAAGAEQEIFQAALVGLVLGGRASVYNWHDPLREDRDATSFGYVVAPEYFPIDQTRLRVEWEHNMNRLVGQRFRIVGLVGVQVGP